MWKTVILGKSIYQNITNKYFVIFVIFVIFDYYFFGVGEKGIIGKMGTLGKIGNMGTLGTLGIMGTIGKMGTIGTIMRKIGEKTGRKRADSTWTESSPVGRGRPLEVQKV